MPVSLRKIDDTNRTAVLALQVAPEQQQFVGTVRSALRMPRRIHTPIRGSGQFMLGMFWSGLS